MFREAFVREHYDFDFLYDWNLKKAAMKQRVSESNQKMLKERNLNNDKKHPNQESP